MRQLFEYKSGDLRQSLLGAAPYLDLGLIINGNESNFGIMNATDLTNILSDTTAYENAKVAEGYSTNIIQAHLDTLGNARRVYIGYDLFGYIHFYTESIDSAFRQPIMPYSHSSKYGISNNGVNLQRLLITSFNRGIGHTKVDSGYTWPYFSNDVDAIGHLIEEVCPWLTYDQGNDTVNHPHKMSFLFPLYTTSDYLVPVILQGPLWFDKVQRGQGQLGTEADPFSLFSPWSDYNSPVIDLPTLRSSVIEGLDFDGLLSVYKFLDSTVTYADVAAMKTALEAATTQVATAGLDWVIPTNLRLVGRPVGIENINFKVKLTDFSNALSTLNASHLRVQITPESVVGEVALDIAELALQLKIDSLPDGVAKTEAQSELSDVTTANNVKGVVINNPVTLGPSWYETSKFGQIMTDIEQATNGSITLEDKAYNLYTSWGQILANIASVPNAAVLAYADMHSEALNSAFAGDMTMQLMADSEPIFIRASCTIAGDGEPVTAISWTLCHNSGTGFTEVSADDEQIKQLLTTKFCAMFVTDGFSDLTTPDDCVQFLLGPNTSYATMQSMVTLTDNENPNLPMLLNFDLDQLLTNGYPDYHSVPFQLWRDKVIILCKGIAPKGLETMFEMSFYLCPTFEDLDQFAPIVGEPIS
jgi:hypothetical protein